MKLYEMGTAIRKKLIGHINKLEDENSLKALLNYLEESEKSPIILTEEDKEGIEKSESEFAKGEFEIAPNLSVKMNQWLGK